MVGIRTDNTSRQLHIVGHGITVPDSFELSPGVTIVPSIPPLDLNLAAAGSGHFADYATVITGHPLASFAIQIEDENGSKSLAAKSWNVLWLFHLLSLACGVPCCSLYSVTGQTSPDYTGPTVMC